MTSNGSAGKFFGFIWIFFFVVGCAPEVDLERPEADRGTLGEELFEIWLRDTERSLELSEERAALLRDRRQDFIEAVDRTAPPGTVEELDGFLQSFLPVVDSGYFPALTRRIATILEEASQDEEFLAALSSGSHYSPSDFLSPAHRGRWFYEITGYEETPALMAHLGREFARHDGLDEQGAPSLQAPSSFADLLRALADAMNPPPDADGTDELAILLRDLFVVPDPRFRGSEAPRGVSIAAFDDRGVPVVALDNNGMLPYPFTPDLEDPTRAQIDSAGRFVMQDGVAVAVAPLSHEPSGHPWILRDAEGRAEFSPGVYAFEYFDVSDTALPYLVRMASDLAAEGAFYHLMEALRELLGPAVPGEDDRGLYVGFSDDHPVVDLLDALVSGLSVSELPEVLNLIVEYIDGQTEALAFLFYALNRSIDEVADAPGAEIGDDQTLLFDLLDVLREITADPDLFADVMEALRAPIMERTGEAMATLLTHRDRRAVPAAGGPYDTCFYQCKEGHEIGTVGRYECIRACPMDELFSEPMDLGGPETKVNRSMQQRLFHLLWDTAGAPYTMQVEEAVFPGVNLADLPPMIHLPGAAEAFVRAVAGELLLTDYITDEFTQSDLGQLLAFLEGAFPGMVNDETIGGVLSTASELFGARLDPRPTPDQITRLFNQPELRYEDPDVVLAVTSPVGNDGFVMAEHHADGLFAAEASGLIDVLYPLAVAFARHDREDLLPRLFVVVHEHYSGHTDLYLNAAGDPSPMKGSNLVSVEPALLEILEDGTIFEALRGLALSTANLTDDQGVAIDERLRQLVHQWVRNDEGFTMRSGASLVELADGRIIHELSRVDVIMDRAGEMVRRVEDEGGDVSENLRRITEDFLDVVLGAEMVDGEARFTDEGVVALTTHVLAYLARRAERKEAQGTFESWLTEEVPDALVSALVSRGVFAAIDLTRGLQADPDGRELVAGALAHMGDTDDRADLTSLMLYSLIVQTYDVDGLLPLGGFITNALDPDREFSTEPHGALPTATILAHVLGMAGEGDEHGWGVAVMGRGALATPHQDSGWATVLDVVLRYLSDDPLAEDLDEEGFASAFRRLQRWFLDDHRGLERYFKLVAIR